MDKTKIWILASSIVMVGILALGWFVGVEPQLKAKAAADEQRVAVEAQNTATELTNIKLKSDFEKIEELQTQLAGLRSSIPAVGQMPAFLTQLDNLAAASKTKVISLTVSEAVEYTVPETSVPPVEVDGEAETDAADVDVVAEPVPEVPKTITDSRITSENFIAIPIEVSVEGDRNGARSFVDKLQHGPRLFMATQIVILPLDEKPGMFTSTVTGYVYVLLNDEE